MVNAHRSFPIEIETLHPGLHLPSTFHCYLITGLITWGVCIRCNSKTNTVHSLDYIIIHFMFNEGIMHLLQLLLTTATVTKNFMLEAFY